MDQVPVRHDRFVSSSPGFRFLSSKQEHEHNIISMNRQQLAQLEVLWTATETGDHELVDSILEQGKIAPDITDEVRVNLLYLKI